MEFKAADSPDRTPLPSPACTIRASWDADRLKLDLTVPLRAADKLSLGHEWGQDDGAEVCLESGNGPVFVLHGFLDGKCDSVTEADAPAAAAKRVGEGTTFSAQVEATRWTAHWAIRWDALGIVPRAGTTFYFNLGVRRSAVDEWVQWAGTTAQTWVVQQAGVLRLE